MSSLVDAPETGAFIYTFTCRLPFVLGVADGFDHDIGLPSDYLDEQGRVFERPPFVRLRIFNAELADRKFWQANMPRAVEHFYGGDIGSADTGSQLLYEQWISLETPAAFLVGEKIGIRHTPFTGASRPRTGSSKRLP